MLLYRLGDDDRGRANPRQVDGGGIGRSVEGPAWAFSRLIGERGALLLGYHRRRTALEPARRADAEHVPQ